jgi:hypothetical protein
MISAQRKELNNATAHPSRTQESYKEKKETSNQEAQEKGNS